MVGCEICSPKSSANNLNKLIYRARRALEPNLSTGAESRFLLREADLILLRAPGSLWIDVDAFEEQAAAAVKSNTAEAYEAVLDSYTGDLLDEDLYEDWSLLIASPISSSAKVVTKWSQK